MGKESIGVSDLKFSAVMEINEEKFELLPEEDLGGEMAVWRSENYAVYATPELDGVCVPVQVRTMEGTRIGIENYREPVKTFMQYCRLVQAIAGKIIALYEIENGIDRNNTAYPVMEYAINFSGLCVIPALSKDKALTAFKNAIQATGLDIIFDEENLNAEEAYE